MKRQTQLAAAIALWACASGVASAPAVTHLAALEMVAAQGDPMAQTELAARYEHAEGVPKDFQKANTLYCQAAKMGYAEAQFKLGWVYANGRGVARDDGVASALFSLAAGQGHEYAARLLQYVRPRADSQLPACMQPDPPTVVTRPASATAEGSNANESDSGEAATARSDIEHLVRKLAPQYSVDPNLALALISVESDFNPVAISPKNAQGVMQLIPETAARFGVKKVFNPAENIKGGLAYLRWLLAFFQGDITLVLAAYNAGERAVEKYRGIPPYAETRNYVRRITSIYKKSIHPYEANIVEPSPVFGRTKRNPS